MEYSRVHKGIILLLFAVFFPFLLSSCREEQISQPIIHTSGLPPLQFQHQFNIRDTDELILQRIRNVTTDSQGRIYLTDAASLQIHVFSAEGKFETSIGRQGEGPGEFLAILNTYIDQKDRLIVYDRQKANNTIFTQKDDKWEIEQIFDIKGELYGIESADSSGNVVLRQSPPQYPERGAYWYEHELARGHLASGLIEAEVLRFRDMGFLFNGSSLQQIPYGRTTVFAADRSGDIYMVWNESFELAKYNAKLEWVDSISVNLPNQPITTEEMQERLDRFNTDFKSLARQHMPETKPVVDEIHIDENGRIWLKTYDSPEYLVLDADGNPLYSFDLEDGVRLAHVDRSRLYGIELNDSGYQLHVYDYQI
ncbi:MAG: 6-bladed beta-propeller [Bacteroidetes bacterium]|jgi:outer membrane protein assembly factor BamB|nr:6-bladed beta-propeller [Bacteroidota bacterium]